MTTKLIQGDCLEKLKDLPDDSVDSCVTDPPYELGFMGKHWDNTGIANNVDLWCEVLRVLKPGGHLLSFGGSRTYHRMACAIEDAGFEIRDQIMWVTGSGFPKSHNLKGEWSGWGTALKPAHEPIVLARKPLSESTVAQNVLKWRTGALNIDGSRVGAEGGTRKYGPPSYKPSSVLHGGLDGSLNGGGSEDIGKGRWPANFIHDGSDEVVERFPNTKSSPFKSATTQGHREVYGGDFDYSGRGYEDSGSASRFFYCAKASKADRDEGLEGEGKPIALNTGEAHNVATLGRETVYRNNHPTVKPTSLMRYLCKLVTPKGGTVLDPFMGSGSTGKACKLEGFEFIGVEREVEYIKIAEARIDAWKESSPQSSSSSTSVPPEPTDGQETFGI